MPDAEVESILREIREQVHADEERNARHRENAVAAINESHSRTASNGQGLLEDRQEAVRIDTQLSTIARAWDTMPKTQCAGLHGSKSISTPPCTMR